MADQNPVSSFLEKVLLLKFAEGDELDLPLHPGGLRPQEAVSNYNLAPCCLVSAGDGEKKEFHGAACPEAAGGRDSDTVSLVQEFVKDLIDTTCSVIRFPHLSTIRCQFPVLQ